MTEFTDHVERIVRPVRANPARKRRMRRELLAHLTAVYEEERGRLGDERLAVHQALARFGDPAELTRELQASVPRPERVLYARLPGSGWMERHVAPILDPRRTSPWPAVRLAGLFAAAVFAALVLLPLVKVAGGKAWAAARVGWDVTAILTAHAFVSGFLCLGYCRAMSGPFGKAMLVRVAAWGAAAVLVGMALVPLMAAVKPDDPFWAGLPRSPERMAGGAVGGWLFLVALAQVARLVDGREEPAEAAGG